MALSREEFMEFCRNQQTFPSEKYEPYLGDWIAFNREGTEILLHSAISFEDVVEQLRQRGCDPTDHLITYVPAPGDVIERGFILSRVKAPLETHPSA